MSAEAKFVPYRTSRLLIMILAVQVFASFLSEVKLAPVRINIGWAEVNAVFLVFVFVAIGVKKGLSLRGHVLFLILALWGIAATVSLVMLWGASEARLEFSLLNVIALLYQIALAFILFNILRKRPNLILLTLRLAAVTLFVISIWVVLDQINNPNNLLVAGPFRNRAQMGVYMFSAVWILLIYTFWPRARRIERLFGIVLLGLVFYTIASSSRQSIYLVAALSLALFVASFLIVRGRDKITIVVASIILVAVGSYFYFQGSQFIPQLANFRFQFDGLGQKMDIATTSEETITDVPDQAEYFETIQRAGAFRAFQENPVLGIGWMGFYRSSYSPTGHELHSTWLRFVAELGLIGIFLYLLFLCVLFGCALRLFWRARNTPYQLVALVFLIAFTTLTISHYYNRMFTDRVYWLFFTFFVVVYDLVLVPDETPAPVEVPEPQTAAQPAAQLGGPVSVT